MSAPSISTGQGTPISLLFQILGIDQAKTALQSIPAEFQKIQQAAQQAGVNLSTLGKDMQTLGQNTQGLNNVATNLQKVSTEEVNTATNVQKLTTALTEQNTAASANNTTNTEVALGVDKISQAQITAADSTTKLTAEQLKQQQTATGVSTANTEIATTSDKVVQAAQKQVTSNTDIATSVSKVVTTISEEKSAVGNVTNELSKIVSSSDQTVKANENLAQSSQKVVQAEQAQINEAGNVASSLGKVQTANTETATSTNNLASAFTKQGEQMVMASGKTKTVTEGQKSLKSSFEESLMPMTMLSGSAVSLYNTFEDYNRTQIRTEMMDKRAQQAHYILQIAQESLTKAVEKYGPASQQAADASARVEIAQQGVEVADAKAEMAQGQLSEATLRFAQEIIPNLLTTVSSGAMLYSSFSDTIGKSVASFREAAVAEGEMGTSTRLMGLELSATNKAMILAGLTNPFFLALTIGAGLVVAFTTNLGGFRDMLNGVGVALGNALGFLKPVLNLIGGFGQFLVNSLGMGGGAAKAYGEDTKTGMDTASQAANQNKDDMTAFGDAVANITRDSAGNVTGYSTSFSNAIANTSKASAIASKSVDTQFKAISTSVKTELDRSSLYIDAFNTKLKGGNQQVTAADNFKPNTPGSQGHSLSDVARSSGSFGADGSLPKAMADMNAVMVQYDANTKKSYVSTEQLQAEMKAASLTETERKQVLDWVNTLLGIQQKNTGDVTKASQNLTSAAKEGSTAHKELGGSIQEASAQMAEQKNRLDPLTAGHAILNKEIKSVNDSLVGNTQILTNKNLLDVASANAITKQDAAMRAAEVTMLGNIDAQKRYTQQLQSSEGQQLAFGEGAVKQYTELNKTTASIYENAGALAVLQGATASGKAQSDAMTASYYAQGVALEKEKIASAGVAGTVQAMQQEFASGEAQIVAFNKGLEAQALAFEQSKVKVSELQGGLAEFGKEVQSGEAQTVAFQTALVTQQKSVLDYKVAISTATGTLQGLFSQIGSGGQAIDQFNKGYVDSAQAIGDWIQKINEGKGAEVGATTAVEYLAKQYSVTLPAGFNLSSTEYQNWIKVALGSKDEIIKSFDSIASSGTNMLQKVADGMKKGSTDLTTAIKALADQTGLNFTQSMQDAIKPELVANSIRPGFEAGLTLLSKTGTTNQAATDIVTQLTTQIKDNVAKAPQLKEAGDSIIKLLNDPERITDPQKWLVDLKNAMDQYGVSIPPVTKSTTDWNAASQASKGPLQQMNSDVTNLVGSVKQYNAEVQTASQQKWLQNAGPMFANVKSTDNGLGALEAPLKKQELSGNIQPQQMTVAPNTQALDTANTKIIAFKATLATLPAAVSSAVNGANANFAKLDPAPAAAMARFLTFAQSLAALPAGVSQSVNNSNVNFAKLNPVPSNVASIFSTLTQILTTIPAGVSQSVNSSNTNFAVFGKPLQTVLPQIQTDTANAMTAIVNIVNSEIGKIAPIFSAMANSANANILTIQTRSVAVFTAVSANATTNIAKIPPAVSTMANNVNTTIATLQSRSAIVFNAIAIDAIQRASSISQSFYNAIIYVENTLDNLNNKANQIFSSVANSANQATASITNLTNSINSIQDKTVTITTVYKSQGTPGAGQPTMNAQGFGPAIIDHPVNMTVGESGPEYVSIIPLKSGAGSHLSPDERLQAYADPGKEGSNSPQKTFAASGIYTTNKPGTTPKTTEQIPYTNKEFPGHAKHPPEKTHRHNINKDKVPLEPGDYDFENFATYATGHNLHEMPIHETLRRLKLPEYANVHWDKKHDALTGSVKAATHKYHQRLIEEGVYTVYPMYDGTTYSPKVKKIKHPKTISHGAGSGSSNSTQAPVSHLEPLGQVIAETNGGSSIGSSNSDLQGSSGSYSNTDSYGNNYSSQNMNNQTSNVSPNATNSGNNSYSYTQTNTGGNYGGSGSIIQNNMSNGGSAIGNNITSNSNSNSGSISSPSIQSSSSSSNFQQTASGLRGTPITSSEFDNSNGFKAPPKDMSKSSTMPWIHGDPKPPGTGNGNYGGGGGSGFNTSDFFDLIRKMIAQAFGNTTLNLQNVNYIDSNKVYESQKKYISLRTGAMLK